MEPINSSSITRVIDIVSRWVVGLALAFTLFAFAEWGVSAALGALAGGGLASIEWILSGRIGQRISKSEGAARILFTLSFVVKSALTFGAAALALFHLDPRGLALGFGSLFAGVILGALEAQYRASRAER